MAALLKPPGLVVSIAITRLFDISVCCCEFVAKYRARKFQDALEMLKQSLANQPPNSQAFDLYFLSMCSSKLGHHAVSDFFDRAETLKNQFRSKLPFDQQAELDEFSKEAKSLLSLMR